MGEMQRGTNVFLESYIVSLRFMVILKFSKAWLYPLICVSIDAFTGGFWVHLAIAKLDLCLSSQLCMFFFFLH